MSERAAVRRDKLRRQLGKHQLEGILVTNHHNVTYLTGFSGEDSYLLVGRTKDVLISDSRFVVQLKEECPGLDVHIRPRTVGMVESTNRVARKMRLSSLGVEASIDWATYERLSEQLTASVVPTSGLVEQLREIKDREEIDAIRRAIHQAERAIGVIRACLIPEQTERTIAANIEHEIRRFAGRGCSFEPIVAVGARGALPHAPPTDQRMGDGEFVLIDWGAREDLYVSDLTRIFVTGRISPKLELVYGVVLDAQLRAIESMKPGVCMADVDFAARSTIDKAGFGGRFGHGLGHGIGLEVHEAPRLVDQNQRKLKPGMVITVEPGIYIPGWGGVRIEDDVLITRDGHEVLSSLPKSLASAVVDGCR